MAVFASRSIARVLLTSTVFVSVPAAACLPPPPSPKKAGETDEAYSKRLKEERQAKQRQTDYRQFAKASEVYFARIVRSEEIAIGSFPYGRRILVRPFYSVKGGLPSGNIVLQDKTITTCGPAGGGQAVRGSVGETAIIYTLYNPGHKDPIVLSHLADDTPIEELATKWAELKPKLREILFPRNEN